MHLFVSKKVTEELANWYQIDIKWLLRSRPATKLIWFASLPVIEDLVAPNRPKAYRPTLRQHYIILLLYWQNCRNKIHLTWTTGMLHHLHFPFPRRDQRHTTSSPLLYGDPFDLTYTTPGGQTLHVTSPVGSALHSSRESRRQEVLLKEGSSAHSAWRLVPSDPHLRLTMQGEPAQVSDGRCSVVPRAPGM